MKKAFFIICLLFMFLNAKAENYFTRPLKENGIRFLMEAGLGYNHYLSPGGLYKMNQTAYYVSGSLGYELKSLYIGIGGTASRYSKEHLYSFKAYLHTRYILNKINIKPYGEVLGGVVGYLKWNDFVKPYYAFGAGIHILPRVSTGFRIANIGTLDNKKSWELSLCIAFKIGG